MTSNAYDVMTRGLEQVTGIQNIYRYSVLCILKQGKGESKNLCARTNVEVEVGKAGEKRGLRSSTNSASSSMWAWSWISMGDGAAYAHMWHGGA
jgi:hypothetical protein